MKNMKTMYFDCFSGISGDMVLGALVDSGLDIKALESELAKLDFEGYSIRHEKTKSHGISGSRVIVDVSEKGTERNHRDITGIIEKSRISEKAKRLSLDIFKDLAIAESRIHDTDVEKVLFHEIGGTDSMVDIVGTSVGLELLGIEEVYSSKVHIGRGFVECAHGKLPVPAPATLELLKGVPVFSTGIEGELVTPTGAAILKNTAKAFGKFPEMEVLGTGYGAGSRDYGIPNFLRVVSGRTQKKDYGEDRILVVETNIDDMNPEFFDHIASSLEERGSLDVYMTPVYMKKNRPAVMLSVLTSPEKLDDMLSVIFSETTTIGVRIKEVERKKLSREKISVKTAFGEVEVKVSRMDGLVRNIAPEYESCRRIAVEKNVPLKVVYEEAKKAAG